LVAALLAVGAPSAYAYEFERTLKLGDEGEDVKALQIRVAGWYPRDSHRQLKLTGKFDTKTANALKAFQTHYKLPADSIAGDATFAQLDKLEDEDGSTLNFDWTEFDQNYNPRCSEAANKYAETFKGGKVPRVTVKENVSRLMWRLEALRAKLGGHPIGINSGFRSVAYNQCVGGASLSQHLYGTATDFRVADTKNRRVRNQAKGSQFYGIGCYASFTHNHIDLRLENAELPEANYWWWPDRDEEGRDLDEGGKPCWGETTEQKRTSTALLTAVRAATPGAGTMIPTIQEAELFKTAGEPMFNGLAD
jgi:uncharacterized protein YcbK (DUF882 family)